ncbi:MAG: hypothetical protein JXA46_17000 [Dehalococcoidales bacterium]|nr:hypothetical protein [Dehalococcoidales bacterium]
MPEEKVPVKGNNRAASGIFIPAGLLVGLGLGFLFNDLVPWMFIGLGAGFMFFALFYVLIRD